MIRDDIVCHRKERLVAALAALDLRFVAHALHPFVATGWRVAGSAGLGVLPADGKDVESAGEEPGEEGYLFAWCGR